MAKTGDIIEGVRINRKHEIDNLKQRLFKLIINHSVKKGYLPRFIVREGSCFSGSRKLDIYYDRFGAFSSMGIEGINASIEEWRRFFFPLLGVGVNNVSDGDQVVRGVKINRKRFVECSRGLNLFKIVVTYVKKKGCNPKFLVRCGCCFPWNNSFDVYCFEDSDGKIFKLKIGGITASVEEWKKLLLPLLEIDLKPIS